MKWIVNRLLTGLILAGLAWQTGALTSDGGGNPYQTVVDRNVFGLKPPLSQQDLTPPPPPPPPPNLVRLVGFWEYGGKRQVFLKVTELPKPGTPPPKEVSMALDEGERRGAIEVLAIDLKERTVRLRNAGQETNLALVHFITKTAAPTPGPQPGIGMPVPPPGLPQPRIGVPGIPSPIPTPGSASYSGDRIPSNIPTRPLRTTPTSSMALGGIGTTPSAVAQQQQPQLTPEEQIIVMEVERERTKAAVARGDLPPLPPTPLTPAGSAGMLPPQLPPTPGN